MYICILEIASQRITYFETGFDLDFGASQLELDSSGSRTARERFDSFAALTVLHTSRASFTAALSTASLTDSLSKVHPINSFFHKLLS